MIILLAAISPDLTVFDSSLVKSMIASWFSRDERAFEAISVVSQGGSLAFLLIFLSSMLLRASGTFKTGLMPCD